MIAARLSEESYEALVAFTDVHGMTIAALLEAIGRRLRIPEEERGLARNVVPADAPLR